MEFLYKTDNYYAPKAEGSIRWNDPELGIDWGIAQPILSKKDEEAPLLRDATINFKGGLQ